MAYREHCINEKDNFINGWYLSPDLCDEIIETANKKRFFFRFPYRDFYVFNYLNNLDSSLFSEYITQLTDITRLYTRKYPDCLKGSAWKLSDYRDFKDYNCKPSELDTPLIKFQKYYPKRSYSAYHCEVLDINCRRHLVFMTYLNDINDGGETEFLYQKFKCKPEKGLTLIWPVEWPFTHRGLEAPTETKYILTGWFVNDASLKENIYRFDATNENLINM